MALVEALRASGAAKHMYPNAQSTTYVLAFYLIFNQPPPYLAQYSELLEFAVSKRPMVILGNPRESQDIN